MCNKAWPAAASLASVIASGHGDATATGRVLCGAEPQAHRLSDNNAAQLNLCFKIGVRFIFAKMGAVFIGQFAAESCLILKAEPPSADLAWSALAFALYQETSYGRQPLSLRT
jgi:hypothetical protein